MKTSWGEADERKKPPQIARAFVGRRIYLGDQFVLGVLGVLGVEPPPPTIPRKTAPAIGATTGTKLVIGKFGSGRPRHA